MSGTMPVQTNKYASVDEIISGEEMQFPFVVTKFLDIIRNDGQGSAQIRLDEGNPIRLEPGDYIGPWYDYSCSTIYIKCLTEGKTCRVRAVGL